VHFSGHIEHFVSVELSGGPKKFPSRFYPRLQNRSHTCPIEPEDGMGDWEANWNRDVLERIVALLFALANLADLAAGASFLRPRRVLAIVSRGEAEARAFVIGFATGVPVTADTLETTRDAACLAVRLRALALMLCLLLARGFALSGALGSLACRFLHKVSGPALSWLSIPPPLAPDTS
jgi:hypothetical protein